MTDDEPKREPRPTKGPEPTHPIPPPRPTRTSKKQRSAREIAASLPPLSEVQMDRIAALLPPVQARAA